MRPDLTTHRHLDELGSSTEGLVLSISSEALATGHVQLARDILEGWEAYRAVASDQPPCTLAAKTRMFEQRATQLAAVLRGLAELFADIPAIEALTQKLEDIRTRAKAAGALNGGGRFEWVDSLLVKVREEFWCYA